MRLHSVVGAITNSSSELYVVTGSTEEALTEIATWLWDRQVLLPESDPWRHVDLGGWAYVDRYPVVSADGDERDVIAVPYGLPEGLAPRHAPLVHSEYFDG